VTCECKGECGGHNKICGKEIPKVKQQPVPPGLNGEKKVPLCDECIKGMQKRSNEYQKG